MPPIEQHAERPADQLADQLAAQLRRQAGERRWIQGIAGIPGSGKSTLAAALLERLPGQAAVVAMDGFHRTNESLAAMGRRDFKGAPDTFDVAAYVKVLRQLRESDAPVQVPIYDRTLHEPVLESGPVIDPSIRIIITEGNYLLLDQPPWTALSELLDACWFIDTPLEQSRQWIIQRHIRGGRDASEAVVHYERTDLPNARLVIENRRVADEVITLPTP